MTLISSLAIIAFAALIHASFQLSVSVLTLMSGHAIGKRTAHSRLLRLVTGFTVGVGVMTMLLVTFTAYLAANVFGVHLPMVLWALVCGVLVGVGISVWRFYYRPGRGTTLWVPRTVALHLNERSKATKRSAEAFGLGLSTVTGEILFVAAPIIVSALVLIQLSPMWQLVGILLYTIISLSPLLIVSALIGSGHKLSHIQRWRETNKHFLQFAAGSGLLVLGAYVYVEQVITVTVTAAGGR
ncbi:hypothetical protein HY312_01140 [Candidatus Saccharibacteria bacterium]|nr:hypothetical protein [Candidatus Saccharibacteria bacterium]